VAKQKVLYIPVYK